MDQNFLNTVISILGENINRFCCFILKANRIKTEGSRKGNVPFWVGVVKCSFSDCQCKGELSINTEEDDFMTARFSGTILHAVTEIKRRKVTGEERESFKNTLSETSHAPSKIYRDSLAKMSPSKYESRKRGPTAQAMANMKNEAKNNFEFTQLIQDLYKLRIELLNKDEQLAIDNILKRNVLDIYIL